MINNMQKRPACRRAGFTLIETLFAILILTVAIAGPMTIAARGLDAALIAKDQTTAFYLAQDAIENIRHMRDSACLDAGVSPCPTGIWLSALKNTATGATCVNALCTLSSISGVVGSCDASGVCPLLLYDSTPTGDTVTPSIYRRSIEVIAGDSEAMASTTVSWQDVGGVTRSVSVSEEIFDWQ